MPAGEQVSHDDGLPDGTVSWAELFDEAKARLSSAQISDSEVSARRIVEEASGFEGAEFALGLEEPATVRGVAAFDKLIARRLAGEPLQYVLGHWSFRTLDLAVDTRVLIPRPETEEVAGWALDEIDRLGDKTLPIVDLGTGSGAIGLSILVERTSHPVWLTDRSEDAIAVARSNLAGIGRPAARARIATGSWFSALPDELNGTIGVVVSNPPYVAPEDPLPAEVKNWEPTEALIAPDHGLADLRHLVDTAPRWLNPTGALVLELAPQQAEPVADLAQDAFAEVEIRVDMAGRNRAVVARRPIV